MQRNYNYIYKKLVNDEADMIGHIAYSLYKKHKIEYIDKMKNEGKELTDEELKPFNDISSVDSSIQSYRKQAEIILQEFSNDVLSESIEGLQVEAVKNQSDILRDIVSPITPKFWDDVKSGIVSSFIFSLILTLIALIIYWKGSDFSEPIVKNKTEKSK